jgi:hypothetical protein
LLSNGTRILEVRLKITDVLVIEESALIKKVGMVAVNRIITTLMVVLTINAMAGNTIRVGTAANRPITAMVVPSRIGIGTGEIGCPTSTVIVTMSSMTGTGMGFASLRVDIIGLESTVITFSRQ